MIPNPFISLAVSINSHVVAIHGTQIAWLDTEAGLTVAQAVDDAGVFTQNDPYGLMMAFLGMGIVFIALLMFYIIFTNTPRFYTISFKEKFKNPFLRRKPAASSKNVQNPGDMPLSELTGEVNAAIAAAIYLYRSELHDHENTVLTIKKVARTYSPWSSKIYGIRNQNR